MKSFLKFNPEFTLKIRIKLSIDVSPLHFLRNIVSNRCEYMKHDSDNKKSS